jgi:hypothetical protein
MVYALKLRRARTTSSTSTGFTAKAPTATKPSGAGVFDLFDRGTGLGLEPHVPSHILIQPWGTNGNNDTFSMRLWGWNQVESSGTDHEAWIPFLLAELTVVLGNVAGIGTDEFLADTIAVTDGSGEEYFRNLHSPESDTPASIILHLKGAELIEFDFDLAGGQEGVAMNAYWRAMMGV